MSRQKGDIMKIYLIVGGEYSDWYIDGYATTREDAEAFCAEENANNKYSELYVMEVDKIGEVPKISLCYEQEVVFDKKPRTKSVWVMRDEPTRYEFKKYDGKELPKSTIGLYGFGDIITVKVWQTEQNRKKAEKIAQDMLTKFLAEREGIL